MEINKKYKIGILAYGSLIYDQGDKIKEAIQTTIDCETPFGVEYGRKSITRGNAPTLVPMKNEKKINAKILVLDDKVSMEDARDFLYRRECRKSEGRYVEPKESNSAKMRIKELKSFNNVETVIYTEFPSDIDKTNLNPDYLAYLAEKSITKHPKDGITYLRDNINHGIKTRLTEDYKNAILKKTGTNTLDEAIEKLKNKILIDKHT